MTRLKPVLVLNHPKEPVLQGMLSESADKEKVLARSFQQLVTRHGMNPDDAKRLLGLPPT
jgi:hypothetical protein